MEITLEAIISFIGLFVGGGAGAFFTWRYQKKKAKAEAESAEIDAAKDLQDMYQQMLADAKTDREDRKQQIEELRAERDHYKDERNELRDKMEQLTRSFMDWRIEADNDRSKMKMDIAKLGRKVEMMAPFMCGDLSCKLRQRVVISENGEIKTKRPEKPTKKQEKKPADIEPLNSDEL
jgi:hypothetical protein